ncbi:MAG: T9SS type A sorting domain-containing protein [Lewinellaceae bacterium]|nr:T9SS type A sorting domain-containing protein [Lewinellaceae bacterium]
MKNPSVFYLLLLVAISPGVPSVLWSQDALLGDRIYRRYATQEVHQRKLEASRELALAYSGVEETLKEKSKKLTFKQVTLPLVFHLLVEPGKPSPQLEEIIGQVESLNRDFGKPTLKLKHAADTLEHFAERAVDTRISFCLAKEDPTGKKETAIRLVEVNRGSWGLDESLKFSDQGGADPWDTQQYINVWVADLGGTYAGYAQLPGGPATTDGIVIDYRFLGKGSGPYTEGKTLTHLIGNYLGLRDLWDEYIPCGDDDVADTPIANAPNYGCMGYRHVSLCGDNPVEMTMNFMDNSDDACTYLFTLGQQVRMQAALTEGGPRSALAQTKTQCGAKSGMLSAAPAVNSPISPEIALQTFPNPTTGELTVRIRSTQGGEGSLTIYSATGAVVARRLLRASGGTEEFRFDGSQWGSGIYVVKVTLAEQVAVEQIVIN